MTNIIHERIADDRNCGAQCNLIMQRSNSISSLLKSFDEEYVRLETYLNAKIALHNALNTTSASPNTVAETIARYRRALAKLQFISLKVSKIAGQFNDNSKHKLLVAHLRRREHILISIGRPFLHDNGIIQVCNDANDQEVSMQSLSLFKASIRTIKDSATKNV